MLVVTGDTAEIHMPTVCAVSRAVPGHIVFNDLLVLH